MRNLLREWIWNNLSLVPEDAEIPTRRLGRTGLDVPIISLGGQGSLETQGDEVESNIDIIQRAYELGIRYFDTSPVYGKSEEFYGKAMKGWREKIFLASKTDERSRDGSLRLLEKSLKRLKTDYLDLWQIHHLGGMDEVDEAEDGALKALLEMKDEGVVRNIGFTGHEDPDVLVEMSRRHQFDTVLCPVNAGDPNCETSFVKIMLPVAKEQDLGVIGMKVLAQGFIFDPDGINSTRQAMGFSMSCPVSTLIIGCDSIGQLEENVAIAKTFRQLSGDEMKAISDKAKDTRRACFFRKEFGGYDSRDELGEPYAI